MGDNNTFGIQAGQAALNTGQGAIGALIGQVFAGMNDRRQVNQQEKLNEQSFEINNRMAEENYKRQMRLWNETNYNAQVEQMKKAGINPGLMYGMSGGGGQTAAATPAQGVSGAHAPSGGGEIMGMQLMAAQRGLIEAQTKKTEAEAENLPKTGANIEASTASLTQGIENAKAVQALTEVQTRIANIQAEVQGKTIDEAISTIQSISAHEETKAINAMTEANVNRDTAESKIEIMRQEAIGALIKNDVMRKGMELTDAQINKMAADIMQKAQEIEISGKAQNTRQKEYELNYKIKDITESGRLVWQTVSGITQIAVGAAAMRGGKGRTETHQYSQPGYKHTITNKY